MSVEPQQCISLSSQATAEINERVWCFPGVPCCAFGKLQETGFPKHLMCLGPKENVSGAAIAPTGHGTISVIHSTGEVPWPPQSAPGSMSARPELCQTFGKIRRPWSMAGIAPAQDRIK